MRTIPGIAVGIVKEVRAGEVKLEFPWLNQSYRTDWVAVAAPMSGNERGIFFMPEPEDEVLVAFERGHFDHPYVVGFLWNGVDKTPETTRQNRVIVTPGGHTIRFEDTEGARKIIIKSDGDHQVVLDDVAHAITIGDEAGRNQIVIQTQGGQIKIQATANVTVEAPQINLVENSTHPLVFGDQLLTYLNQLVQMFNTHTHPAQLTLGIFPVVPSPGIPVPPLVPASPAMLSPHVHTG